MDELELTVIFDFVDPEELYELWLDPVSHTEMTGGEATGEPEVGEEFTAWGGYISGEHVELEPGVRIVQRWRTTEFPPEAPDSRLELRFESTGDDGTKLSLSHTDIPDGDGEKYASGWNEHYFEPMFEYFEARLLGEDDGE